MIVTPALAAANNGNWQTARRWSRLLRPVYRVVVTDRWTEGDEALMIALHARRSADSIRAWRHVHPDRPLLVALTGTDLYRDIRIDLDARRSLEFADQLVVLNARGPDALPEVLRGKTRVILQSSPARVHRPRARGHLRALMVGHLRDEKDPRTAWRAARRLAQRSDIRFDHVGAALDSSLGAEVVALAAELPGFRWLGALPHEATLRRIQAAHVLVHPSRMEGGAHVVIEAIRCGTPVLASRIDGNTGLVGDAYEGLFEVGDDAGLAALLVRARDDVTFLPQLGAQLALRSDLFSPQAERASLRGAVAALLSR